MVKIDEKSKLQEKKKIQLKLEKGKLNKRIR